MMMILMETQRRCRGLLMILIMVITLLEETEDGKKLLGMIIEVVFCPNFRFPNIFFFSITMAHCFVFSVVLLSWP